MASQQIDEYQVMYSSNKFPPRIWLKNTGKFIGQLIFLPNGSTLPSDAKSNEQIDLYYHSHDFQNALDLLRNEKPMYLSYLGPGGENGIKTSPESVGERDA